jgi:hypothetical protein
MFRPKGVWWDLPHCNPYLKISSLSTETLWFREQIQYISTMGRSGFQVKITDIQRNDRCRAIAWEASRFPAQATIATHAAIHFGHTNLLLELQNGSPTTQRDLSWAGRLHAADNDCTKILSARRFVYSRG